MNDFSSTLPGIREMNITVTGRKSGRAISLPIWFVYEDETVYLLPAKGAATEWYQNVIQTPAIQLTARGKTRTANARALTDTAAVRRVVEKFQAKYGTGTVNSLYARLDAAVEIPLH